jgi:hypothetical protein
MKYSDCWGTNRIYDEPDENGNDFFFEGVGCAFQKLQPVFLAFPWWRHGGAMGTYTSE